MNTSDQALWNQLADSVIGRIAGACLAAFTAARSDSRVIARATDAYGAWQRFPAAARWRLIGTVLIAAVLTNLGLLSLQRPSGWWWWAIPAVVGGYALVLLVSAMTAKRTGPAD